MKIKSITFFAKSMEALRAEIVRPKVEGNPHLHLKPEPAREGGKMTVLAAIIREFASPFPSLGDGEIVGYESMIAALLEGGEVNLLTLLGDIEKWSKGQWPGEVLISLTGRDNEVTLAPWAKGRVLKIRRHASLSVSVTADYTERPSEVAAGALHDLLVEEIASAEEAERGPDYLNRKFSVDGHGFSVAIEFEEEAAAAA